MKCTSLLLTPQGILFYLEQILVRCVQAAFKVVQASCKLFWKMLSELWIMVFTNILYFFEPAFLVYCKKLFHSLRCYIKACCVNCTLFWHEADRCVNIVVLVVAAVENPCEYTAVV